MKNTITVYVLLLFFACALMFALHISYQKEISKLKSELKECRDSMECFMDGSAGNDLNFNEYIDGLVMQNKFFTNHLTTYQNQVNKAMYKLNKRIDSLETRIPTWVDENDILLNELLQKTYQPDTLRLKFTPNK